MEVGGFGSQGRCRGQRQREWEDDGRAAACFDGTYLRKLGTLVLDAADLIVWLDLPIRVWLPRLLRRTWRRSRTREELWNGNTESLRDAFWGRSSLFGYALQTHFQRRREWPAGLGERPFIRLRTTAQVRDFLENPPARR